MKVRAEWHVIMNYYFIPTKFIGSTLLAFTQSCFFLMQIQINFSKVSCLKVD